MKKPFDPSELKTPSEVAHEIAEVHARWTANTRLRDDLNHAIEDDEETLGHLDRWLLAIFEANPGIECIRIEHDFRTTLMVPRNGFVEIFQPWWAVSLTNMVQFPAEPDLDDPEIDDFDIVGHPTASNVQPVTLPVLCGRSITEQAPDWRGSAVS